jgi:HlyD family secretion protein
MERGNKIMKKHIALLLLIAILSAAGLTGCGSAENKPDNSVQTSSDTGRDVMYLMAGKIEVGESIDLKSVITAKVVQMNVNIGSKVKKGDPILQLDTRDLQAQSSKAGAALSQAQSSLAGAKAAYKNAEVNYGRNNQLFQAGAISQQELQQSKNELDAAETAKDVGQSQMEQAQAVITETNIQLDNGMITSPISGVVTAKTASAGEVVSAGAPLLTIVNPETLLINAYIPEDILSQIKVGQQVVVKIPEVSKDGYKGELSVIDSAVDPVSKTILVKVSFNTQDTQLRPGMFAEVGIRN